MQNFSQNKNYLMPALFLVFILCLQTCKNNSSSILAYSVQADGGLSIVTEDPLINSLTILQSVDNPTGLGDLFFLVIPQEGGQIIEGTCTVNSATLLLDCRAEGVETGKPYKIAIYATDGTGQAFGKTRAFILSDSTPIDITMFLSNVNRFSSTVKKQDDGSMVLSELNVARQYHTATLLNDGTVLIVGGYDTATGQITGSAEYYNPATGEFIALDANLITPRARHSASLLPNGSVLIAGGTIGSSGGVFQNTDSAEIYDPVAKTFTPLSSSLTTPMADHQAIELNSGNLLFAGRNKLGDTIKVRNNGPVFLESDGSQLNPVFAQVFNTQTNEFADSSQIPLADPSINFSSVRISLRYDIEGGTATTVKTPISSSTITFDSTILDPKLVATGTNEILLTLEGWYLILDNPDIGNLANSITPDISDLPDGLVLTGHSSVPIEINGAAVVGTYLNDLNLTIDTNYYYAPQGTGWIAVKDNVVQLIDAAGKEAQPSPFSLFDLIDTPQLMSCHEVVRLEDKRYLYTGGYDGLGQGEQFSVNVNFPARSSQQECDKVCVGCIGYTWCGVLENNECITPPNCGTSVICGSCQNVYTYYQPTVGTLTGSFTNNIGNPLTLGQILIPSSKTFRAVDDQMNIGRVGHTMTLLPDGTVLIIGQNKQAEIYNYVR